MTDSKLVVDLRGRLIETLNDFWDAVSEPCGLPKWFGRNLDAWSDTIETRGISEVIDSHDVLVVHVDQRGLFGGDRREAASEPGGRPLARPRRGRWLTWSAGCGGKDSRTALRYLPFSAPKS